jgi:hypothetical protein
VTGENLSGLYGVPIRVVSVRLRRVTGPEIPVCIPVPDSEQDASRQETGLNFRQLSS